MWEETWNWISGEYFVQRWQCCSPEKAHWPYWLASWYIVANGMIAIAYHSIPWRLFCLYREDKLGLPPRVYLGFLLFILFCGTGHLLDGVLAFWWPNYFFFAVWHTITACLSWWAASNLGAMLKSTDVAKVASALVNVEEALNNTNKLKILRNDSGSFDVYEEQRQALVTAHEKLKSVL